MRVIASYRRSVTLAAGIATVAMTMACSPDSTGGEPGPANSQPATTTPVSSLPHSGAPKVTTPMADVSAFESDPCSVATAEQFKSIGLKIRKSEADTESATGPSCNWFFDPAGTGTIDGSFMSANSEGLSNLYAKDKAGEWGLFQDAGKIDGHPAVFASREDERGDGACNLEVGLRDDLTFFVGVGARLDEGPLHKDPCGAAKKVAGLVIKTLKGGA